VALVLAGAYQRLGALRLAEGKPAEAPEYFGRELGKRQWLVKQQPGNASYHAALCVAQARCGEQEAARKRAEGLLKQAPRHPEIVLQGARCFALCAADARADRAELTDRAVGLLSQAVGQGYRNRAALETEPEWRGVAESPAFRALLGRIGEPTPRK
jgi:hypothetical protein